jgi:predicted DNA-binding protein (UPF0251 family)
MPAGRIYRICQAYLSSVPIYKWVEPASVAQVAMAASVQAAEAEALRLLGLQEITAGRVAMQAQEAEVQV